MSDNENNLFDLEGDALDEALLAAIDETDEEERLAREKKAQENLERAEQARITAIEKEQARAKIDELRKNLPNEGRRYFLPVEEFECFTDRNEATLTGVVYGTLKKGDDVYLYRKDGRALGTKVLSVEAYNNSLFEPAEEVSQNKAKVTIAIDYAKTGFTADDAVSKFSILTSVKPPVKDDKGKMAIENPMLSGLMFKYPEYNKDKEYISLLMGSIANGRFLVPAMDEGGAAVDGKKKLKVIMVTKKESPDKRALPLFTDLQALYLWRQLFEGEKKPSIIVMTFPEASKFVSKDGFDIVFNPSGPVSFGLPNNAVSAMSNVMSKHQAGAKVEREVINDGSKVIVGVPRPGEETESVRRALINYCKKNTAINKAGLMMLIRNGRMSYLVITDSPKVTSQVIFKGISEALKPHLTTTKRVDFSLYSEAPFAKDYFAKQKWDYERV